MSSNSAFGTSRRDQLERIALAVNYAIDGHPQCIAGAAILVLVAEYFGIELSPRAVGLAGQSPTGTVLTTGVVATEHIRAHGGGQGDPIPMNEVTWAADSGFRQSGHMIAVDESSNLLIDPSLEQYAALGFPDTVICVRVDPRADEWPVPFEGGGFIVYLPKADAGGWQDGYEAARAAAVSMAAEIAAHLKAGGAPNTHGVTLDFDGAILR